MVTKGYKTQLRGDLQVGMGGADKGKTNQRNNKNKKKGERK